MLVMLAYDVPETKYQTLLRKEFEALGGQRVQYSLYLFEGEDHEIDRVIRYMRRVAAQVPQGDIRLIPMERSVWEQQVVLLGESEAPAPRPFPKFVLFW
ncbi:MAG: CRISPR-associated endonuclease Cas2 [Akkermansia sp.]|nr:CRISPR-associated endonuclease Cas2 [Akkermansia sp.]